MSQGESDRAKVSKSEPGLFVAKMLFVNKNEKNASGSLPCGLSSPGNGKSSAVEASFNAFAAYLGYSLLSLSVLELL